MKIPLLSGLSKSELKILIIIAAASSVFMILIVGATLFFRSGHEKEETLLMKELPSIPLLQQSKGVLGEATETDIDANVFAGIRYYETNDYEHAIKHLKRAVSLRSDDYETRSTLADAYLESGEYEKALTQYDYLAAIELPDSISKRICARQAICQFYNSERTQSLEALKRCIELHPQNAESYCFLGQIEASMKIPSDEALRDLNKAIELDSNYVEAWYQLARYHMQISNYLKAREALLRAIEINPLHCKSQSRLGMVYYYLNSYDPAIKAYQTALALNPLDFNTRYNLGEVYYAQNDTANAIRAFKKTLDYNPGHVEANFKLGLLLLGNNMVKEAINHFEQAAHNSPQNARILIQLAVAYEKLGDRNKALSIYQSILEFDELNTIAKGKVRLLTE